MKKILIIIALFFNASIYANDTLTTAQETMDLLAMMAKYDSIGNSFVYQYGFVPIGNGIASINVPEGFKFLDSKQSQEVLTDLWGNPPSEVLGMLFPKDITPVSDNFTYAVEITYSEEGYIEDDDAEDLDYDDLLKEMQDDANAMNEERIKQDYEPIELVGWASEPFYDKENKKLHWAKELKFGDQEINTLNYNIRILGRKGFLNMNAIGDINILPEVKEDIDIILESVEFNEGSRYADFNPDVDDIAVYGIGGLIAGKMLAKVGFFAVILKFWKIGALAIFGLFSAFKKRIFGGKRGEEEVRKTPE